ncbi:MAG: cell envelope integrity protein CreD [Spirulina sp. SIO3F2]|nr:cell envelope integrity protein CreD [Spirulina sp. SIO3F2]
MTNSNNTVNALGTLISRILNSQFTRILIVTLLILVLQIPIVFLQNLVYERQQNYQAATSDITEKWGDPQTFIGPQLNIPYIVRTGSGDDVQTIRKQATFLADDLTIAGNLTTEVRYRGLFEVPVYQADLTIKGQFGRPFTNWDVKPEDVLWDEAELSIQIADTRAIQNQGIVLWNKQEIPLEPGQGTMADNAPKIQTTTAQPYNQREWVPTPNDPNSVNSDSINIPGIHVPLRDRMEGETFKFELPLQIKGSQSVYFAPFGRVTQVKLTSDWPDPSFQGPWLPSDRTVNIDGFTANWSIPSLGRSYAQYWNNENPIASDLVQQSLFGVDLIAPVDNYRMVERSIKYNFIFLVLTFAVFWLFEVIVPLRVHPLQYLLVGTAMSLFYLLQLALSEHIGFQSAYLTASVAVAVMITSYSIAVLKANRRGGVIGVTQVALYGYLYVVLAHQDFSLLIGSLGLFVFLGIVMFFTRNVDWANPQQVGESSNK